MLHSTGFYWLSYGAMPVSTNKKHYALRCDDLCYRSLTLVRPELSCGGRDLEAAVTLALDVARFPVQNKTKMQF